MDGWMDPMLIKGDGQFLVPPMVGLNFYDALDVRRDDGDADVESDWMSIMSDVNVDLDGCRI